MAARAHFYNIFTCPRAYAMLGSMTAMAGKVENAKRCVASVATLDPIENQLRYDYIELYRLAN